MYLELVHRQVCVVYYIHYKIVCHETSGVIIWCCHAVSNGTSQVYNRITTSFLVMHLTKNINSLFIVGQIILYEPHKKISRQHLHKRNSIVHARTLRNKNIDYDLKKCQLVQSPIQNNTSSVHSIIWIFPQRPKFVIDRSHGKHVQIHAGCTTHTEILLQE